MNKKDKILILGGTGLVGSALIKKLESQKFTHILSPKRSEVDLLNQQAVLDYFKIQKPDHLILAAAKVGGILANNTYRADFIFENLTIATNVFNAAFKHNVDKLLYLASTCIYPRECPQPIKEEYLLTSSLEQTNEPYAISKIAGLKMAENFKRQYQRNFFSIMPTNLYGPGDHYHPQNGHVIPSLIAKMKIAIDQKLPTFEVWGTGTPRREFLYVDDLADACIFLMNQDISKLPYYLNVGTGIDISIKELAELIGSIMKFKGQLVFNSNYPDGTPQKLCDISKIQSLGWKSKTALKEGLISTINDYLKK